MKIEGIKPFNNCFFRSCYYHQLIAGMSGLGLPPDNILLTAYTAIEKDFKTRTELNDETLMEKNCGCKLKEKRLTKRLLIRSVDKGHPIIAGIDCFYLQSREDTYKKRHGTHFLLVYGYDLENDLVNVVDHNYINSYKYVEKEISLQNLLEANSRFRSRNKKNCTVLSKSKIFNIGCKSLWRYIGPQEFFDSRVNSADNLQRIKQLIEEDTINLPKESSRIAAYLEEIKSYMQALSVTAAVSVREQLHRCVTKLIAGYSFLLSLFWKINEQGNYQYIVKVKDKVFEKIDNILVLEGELYSSLEDIRRCNSGK